MKVLITVLLLLTMVTSLGNTIIGSDRRYQPIAQVDKRAFNNSPYVLYIVEMDTEANVAKACGATLKQFTGRGCTKELLGSDGKTYYQIIVLSHDFVALRHELNHVIHGPCHISARGGATPRCKAWLIKNKLKPIGSQYIGIKTEEIKK